MLSQSWQLVIYLHQHSKYVKRERAIVVQMRRVDSSRDSKEGDHSALQVQYAKIAQEFDELGVGVAAMNPPQSVAASHELAVRYLRTMYEVMTALSNVEADAKISKSLGRSDALRALALYRQGQSESAAWWFELRVTAKKLHVRIPFRVGLAAGWRCTACFSSWNMQECTVWSWSWINHRDLK